MNIHGQHRGIKVVLGSPNSAGRIYHDFFGENLFRTDIGIERVAVGSLLDHTGAFGECERNAARIFGADQSYPWLWEHRVRTERLCKLV